jgi:hypothetical protein
MTTEKKVKQCLKKFGFEKFRTDIQEKAILSIINGLFIFILIEIIYLLRFYRN